MRRLGILIALVLAAGFAPAAVPFRMPVGTVLSEPKAESAGWQGSGEIPVPFVQARARLMSSATAAGWRFVHEIPLGARNERLLLAFARGERELTLMVWRMDIRQSGFSYGISRRGK